MKFKKILVVSIGDAVTGGPEALHHLVNEMRNQGYPAYICYFPFDQNFNVPSTYSSFETPISEYSDDKENLIIFPEVLPMQALNVKNAKSIIWWLSLDNFYQFRPHVSWLRNKIRYYKSAYKGDRPWLGIKQLKSIGHLVQSNYVKNVLEKNKITSFNLFEPINRSYIELANNNYSRGIGDEVLYNPAKGFHLTKKIIDANPDIKFTPLKGFTKFELIEKLKKSKLYIDFGHHPGRDRLPREACILGCCIVTSKMGAAKGHNDLPIPDKYKVDQSNSNFVSEASVLIKNIIHNYSENSVQFDYFREVIKNETHTFQMQINQFLNL